MKYLSMGGQEDHGIMKYLSMGGQEVQNIEIGPRKPCHWSRNETLNAVLCETLSQVC